MNVPPLRIASKIFLLGFFSCALLATTRARADADTDKINGALAAAQSWLAQIDSGKYDESYAEGCTAFHNKVTQDQWNVVLKALRPQLGTLVSRKVVKTDYKPDGVEGLEGECMVITYNTSFSKVASDLEVVVLKREDGQWRGAGYNAQPQSDSSDADIPPPDAHTDVSEEKMGK